MELPSCHPPGDWNFEVVPRVLENLWTPVIALNGRYEVTSTQVYPMYFHPDRRKDNTRNVHCSRDSSVGTTSYGMDGRRSNPGGGEIFRTGPDRHWDPSSLQYNGYRVFPGAKAARAWR